MDVDANGNGLGDEPRGLEVDLAGLAVFAVRHDEHVGVIILDSADEGVPAELIGQKLADLLGKAVTAGAEDWRSLLVVLFILATIIHVEGAFVVDANVHVVSP